MLSVPRLASGSRETLTFQDFESIETLPSEGIYISELVRGTSALVKGRFFVLKTVIDPKHTGERDSEQCILQHLSHPSVTAFVASLSSRVHVVEHCSSGSLRQFLKERDHDHMAECEVASLLKGVADALEYLAQELIVHRDVNPDNIHLTSAGQPKLSNFSSATRLSSAKSTASGPYGAFEYRSPEMITSVPYDFATDVWSFGCVVFLCATGYHPFMARVPQMTADNIYRASYSIPRKASATLRNLLDYIFQPTATRISSRDLAWHPFFTESVEPAPGAGARPTTTGLASTIRKPSAFPVQRSQITRSVLGNIGNTDLRRLLSDEVSGISRARRIVSEPVGGKTSTPSLRWPSQPFRHQALSPPSRQPSPSQRLPTRPTTPSLDTSISTAPSSPESDESADPLAVNRHQCLPSEPLVNPLKRLVSGSSEPKRLLFDPVPRVVSDPMVQQRTASTSISKLRVISDANTQHRLVSEDFVSKRLVSNDIVKQRLISDLDAKHRLFSDATSKHRTLFVSSTPSDKLTLAEVEPAQPTTAYAPQAHSATPSHRIQSTVPSRPAQPVHSPLPIGTVRPTLFSTHLMAPKSHKALHGQVTVLPSRSLLIDFREAERRRGAKGTTVLVVGGDGERIKVYSAPHLSAPCCLTEPLAEYELEALPSSYWKSYNDAAALVEKIKQRTPRLVMYEENVKCTLMANAAPGDIELDFYSVDSARSASDDPGRKPTTTMRIRLSRKTRSLELIRDVGCSWTGLVAGAGSGPASGEAAPFGSGAVSASGSEWVRKTYVYSGDGYDDADALRDVGSHGMAALARFMEVCERVEADDDVGTNAATPYRAPEVTAHRASEAAAHCDTDVAGRSSTQDLLPSLDVAPPAAPTALPKDKPFLGNATPNLPSTRKDSRFLGLNVNRRPSKLWSGSYSAVIQAASGAGQELAVYADDSDSPEQDSTFRRDFRSIGALPALKADDASHELGDTGEQQDDEQALDDADAQPADDDSRIHVGASFFQSLDWTSLAVPGIATRFLPNVGWCIRYGSRVSQGGRFRIMYLDGATMDIDVDEEWVELQQEGVVVRVGMRDPRARRKLGGRMKAFEEFVSMFDEDEEDEGEV
ncbi:uncharacterized protein SCHCODRAFT_02569377 [Schizophyllum commune H4-8]|uniref:uncharacterized protein n=1 Tax=Schizophyllum commune (strain H4-8 / FGSC 9210) TaxID=578458 RepID=UPI00215E0D98|nr:uncharacterized protein SCHCODRAFT_02569377 [Schizophyllum commune H4-8]KAI5896605.1 hypothetical protein SCHCODRAFT_02569377 [Schizophyllum commune H4-8]